MKHSTVFLYQPTRASVTPLAEMTSSLGEKLFFGSAMKTVNSAMRSPHLSSAMNSVAYPCASVPEVPEGHYSRRRPCPSGQWAPHNEAYNCTQLSERMKHEGVDGH